MWTDGRLMRAETRFSARWQPAGLCASPSCAATSAGDPEKMSVPQRMGFALFSDALRCCCGRHRDDGGGESAEIAYTPTDSSWLNRIEAQFTALREFTLNGTDHVDHREQGSVIRRYIAWRNRNIDIPRLRWVVSKANVA